MTPLPDFATDQKRRARQVLEAVHAQPVLRFEPYITSKIAGLNLAAFYRRNAVKAEAAR